MKVIEKPRICDMPGRLLEHLQRSGCLVMSVACPKDSNKTIIMLEDNDTSDIEAVLKRYVGEHLELVSDKPLGLRKYPLAKADGVDVHTITISFKGEKGQIIDESGTVLYAFMVMSPSLINPERPVLQNGVTTIVVGPSSAPRVVKVIVKHPQSYQRYVYPVEFA